LVQDFNPGSPEYETEVLAARQRFGMKSKREAKRLKKIYKAEEKNKM
jgi:hypothetical protein